MINKDNLINALEEIDDEFIKEALSYGVNEDKNDEPEVKDISIELKKNNKREVIRTMFKITAIAACVVLVILLKPFIYGSVSKSGRKNVVNENKNDVEPAATAISADIGSSDDHSWEINEPEGETVEDGVIWDDTDNQEIFDNSKSSSKGSGPDEKYDKKSDGEVEAEDIITIDDIIRYKEDIYLVHKDKKYYVTEIYYGENIDTAKSLINKKLFLTCSKEGFYENNNQYYSPLQGVVYSIKDADENSKLCICFKDECYVIFESK